MKKIERECKWGLLRKILFFAIVFVCSMFAVSATTAYAYTQDQVDKAITDWSTYTKNTTDDCKNVVIYEASDYIYAVTGNQICYDPSTHFFVAQGEYYSYRIGKANSYNWENDYTWANHLSQPETNTNWYNVSGRSVFSVYYTNVTIYNYRNGQVTNEVYYQYVPQTTPSPTPTPEPQVPIPSAYLSMNLCKNMPYYALIQKAENIKYFVFSELPFYFNSDGKLHKSSDVVYCYTYDDVTWTTPASAGDLTQLIGGITPVQVLYNNHDIYGTNVSATNLSEQAVINNKTTTVVKSINAITDLNDDCQLYSYEYSTSIENVNDMTIEKKSMLKTDWGLTIGQSKNIYIVKWSAPEVSGLHLEIAVQSKFGTMTRRWNKQTYNNPYYDTYTNATNRTFVLPNDLSFEFDINALGRTILLNVWNDVDTGEWYSIPPTEFYFRYVSLDDTTSKALFGNWTRLDFSGGPNGIIETMRDTVTTTESINPETGQTEYTDITVDGNETGYINANGEEIDESQSFNGAVDTIDSALSSSTSAIQNIGVWLGQVPALIGNMFSFIPQEAIAFIGLAFVLLMILKIAGR